MKTREVGAGAAEAAGEGRMAPERDSPLPASPAVPSVREIAVSAGYRDDCRACIRAVALSGGEACSRHYIPICDRPGEADGGG